MRLEKSKASHIFWQTVEILPVAVPAFIAIFGAVAVGFLLLGEFNPYYIWPIGSVLGFGAVGLIARHYPKIIQSKPRKICNSLVIIGVLVWGSFNIFYTTQHLLTNRDPALYANAGVWLVKHDNLNIPVLNTFGKVSGVSQDGGAGFQALDNHVYAQGAHLLPAFLGLSGRIFGLAAMFHINVLFGMSALLAVYSFGRILVKRTWWAVVATGVLAASMPLIYFSRDTYSEPLAATFTFGALAMLWLALRSKKISIWFIAGLLAGAGAMTRIDGYLTIAEISLFVAIMLSISPEKDRKATVKQSLALIVGMATTGLIGWLDVSQLSTPYYNDLASQFHREVFAIIAIGIVGAVIVFLSWRTSFLVMLDAKTKQWRSTVIVGLVLLTAIALASRPLWQSMFLHTKAYSDITTQWVSWYIGPILASLGVIGVAIFASRALKRPHLFTMVSLLVVVSTAVFYLLRPSISPDQIWASRRLLPVILPGIAVFGVAALDYVSNKYFQVNKQSYFYIGLISLALIIAPLVTSKPLLGLRPYTEYAAVKGLCDALPKDAAVLWLGRARIVLVQPTRGVCGVPALAYGKIYGVNPQRDSPSKATLIEVYKNAKRHHKRPIVGVLGPNSSFLSRDSQSNVKVVSSYTYSILERPILTPPKQKIVNSGEIELGSIQPDGTILPL